MSFAIIYYAQTKKQEFARELPNLAACEDDVPSLVYGGPPPDVRDRHRSSALRQQPHPHCPRLFLRRCVAQGIKYYRNRTREALECAASEAYITVNNLLASNFTAVPCVAPCVGPGSISRCTSSARVFTHSTLAACYCRQELQAAIVGASCGQRCDVW